MKNPETVTNHHSPGLNQLISKQRIKFWFGLTILDQLILKGLRNQALKDDLG